MLNQKYYRANEVVASGQHWTYKVLLASFPTRSMGPMVRAVLGKQMARGPKLSLSATIASDGMVYAGLKHDETIISFAHPLGTVTAIRDEFRRLADHCRLNDAERLELFEQLRKWMGKDLRSEEDRVRI